MALFDILIINRTRSVVIIITLNMMNAILISGFLMLSCELSSGQRFEKSWELREDKTSSNNGFYVGRNSSSQYFSAIFYRPPFPRTFTFVTHRSETNIFNCFQFCPTLCDTLIITVPGTHHELILSDALSAPFISW